jgi:hypothetical protein
MQERKLTMGEAKAIALTPRRYGTDELNLASQMLESAPDYGNPSQSFQRETLMGKIRSERIRRGTPDYHPGGSGPLASGAHWLR